MNTKKQKLTTFLLVLALVVITIGTTYAFFTYNKEGTKTVTMTSGSIKLHYQESSLNNINLTNALPMDDTRGKAQTDYFEFTITSTTAGYEIPYYVTSRVTTNENSQIPASYISLYLTEVVNNSEVEVLDTTYDNLTNVSKNNHIEEQLMNNIVAANTANYEKTYRLRLWINETADYTPTEENGVQTYPMQDKSFDFIINVYTEVEEYVASCGIEPDDRYCFGTECFRVVDADCSGNTVLLAERNLNIYGDDYSNATGVQFVNPNEYWLDTHPTIQFTTTRNPKGINGYVYGYEYNGGWVEHTYDLVDYSYYWYNSFGENDLYPGDFDSETVIKYPYVFDASKTQEIPANSSGSKINNTKICNNGNCLGYFIDEYENILKTQQDSIPATSTVRLLSKEEADKVIENNLSFANGYSFWLGSLANETSDIFEGGYNEYYEVTLTINDYMWVFNGTSLQQVKIYDEEDYNYSDHFNRYAVRAAIEIPTSYLLNRDKLEITQTTPYVYSKAQSIATAYGLDYDNMNTDYDLVYAFTYPTGRYTEKSARILEADVDVIEIFSNTSKGGYYGEEECTTILNYLKTLADDGKIYKNDGTEFNPETASPASTYNTNNGYVTINGTKYYFNVDGAQNKNHYLFGQYASYYYLELSTSNWLS